jgi:hypothetical protein
LRSEIARLEAEIDAVRPYLGLAREIHDSVVRLNENGDAAGSEALAAALDAIPARERADIARKVFDRLSAQEQWTVLERVFGDTELRSVLETERAVRVAQAATAADRVALAADVRTQRQLDTERVPSGETLTLGLFRENDVAVGASQSAKSSACARRLTLRATGGGVFQVLEDVFNPAGGYFVTPDYDEQVWRTADRLSAHALVRVGSITGGAFTPTLFLGGRVDVEVDGRPQEGRLHLGFAVLGDVDLFVDKGVVPVPEKRIP